MSPRPPLLAGRQLVKIFRRLGYREVSPGGGPIKIRNDDTGSTLIIPNHKEVDRWTLRTIRKQAEIPEERFREFCKAVGLRLSVSSAQSAEGVVAPNRRRPPLTGRNRQDEGFDVLSGRQMRPIRKAFPHQISQFAWSDPLPTVVGYADPAVHVVRPPLSPLFSSELPGPGESYKPMAVPHSCLDAG